MSVRVIAVLLAPAAAFRSVAAQLSLGEGLFAEVPR